MSRAEKLASRLDAERASREVLYGIEYPELTDAAAHLRALDASHQRLVEALEAFVEYDDSDADDGIETMRLYAVAIESARAALESAQALSNQVKP